MIEEEDFAIIEGLEPSLAFVRLNRRFRAALKDNLDNTDSSNVSAHYIQEYINHVIAAAKALDISGFDSWRVPSNDAEIWETYRKLVIELDRYSVQIQIQNIRRPSRNFVGLESTEKREIRHYVEQIKAVIENSTNIEVAKRERLQSRLNDFLHELDKDRTPVQVFSDIVIELSRTAGEAAAELEPAWKWVKLIARVIGGRQDNEQTMLPKPPPQRKLPAPKETDDFGEIPF